jgi:hypothetical protein
MMIMILGNSESGGDTKPQPRRMPPTDRGPPSAFDGGRRASRPIMAALIRPRRARFLVVAASLLLAFAAAPAKGYSTIKPAPPAGVALLGPRGGAPRGSRSLVSLPSSRSSRERGDGGSAGRGMGMGKAPPASSSSSPRGGSKKKKSKKKPGGTAPGASPPAASSAPFDVAASVLRLEKKYDRLLLEASRRLAADELRRDQDEDECGEGGGAALLPAREFVVAARDGDLLPDWVPIAQLLLVGGDDSCLQSRRLDPSDGPGGRDRAQVRRAVSAYRRELHHVAGLSSGLFRSVPRHRLRYAAEPADSFYRHVYERVSPAAAPPPDGRFMSGAEARKVLGLSEGGTLRDLKLQYRRRSLECHPDRVRHQQPPSQREEEEDEEGSSSPATTSGSAAATAASAAAEEFGRVKLAYETLLGGGSVRREGSTWYESLGGRGRSEFAAVPLLPAAPDGPPGPSGDGLGAGLEAALAGLDPELVQSFVARSRSSRA